MSGLMYVYMALEGILVVILVYCLFLLMSKSMEKSENSLSPYECGFDPAMGSRVGFSYRFFLISILFLVFDVEVSLLLPLPYLEMNFIMVVMGVIFMMILLFGLVYEYFNGVLSWVI